jgi:uroporphyrinogen-III decarboxylase
MDSRKRIAAILDGQEPDRVGFQDTDFFSDTIERWRAEGLPRAVDVVKPSLPWLNVPALKYFGADIYVVWTDISPKYDAIDYQVGEDWCIAKDEFGATKKSWTTRSASPQYLEPVVKTPQDFREKIDPLLDHEDMRRVSSSRYPFKHELAQMVNRFQHEFFVVVGMAGPLEYSTYLCGGLAATLIFVMKNQDFASYMFSRIGDFLRRIGEGYIEAGVDGLWLFDDQGSQDGPFFSPRLYAKLLKPAHETVCEPFRRRRLPRLIHSDGYLEPIVSYLIEAGFVALHPLQNKAGMDVRRLKEKYGKELTLIGGIDTRILSSGDLRAIENEVRSKIGIAGQGGGYIVASDGPVPPTISLASYRFFVEQARKHGSYPLKA